MAKYGKTAQGKVAKAMRERKRGTLKSGGSGKNVTSRKQAIAIGLSEARKRGVKVPAIKTGRNRAKITQQIVTSDNIPAFEGDSINVIAETPLDSRFNNANDPLMDVIFKTIKLISSPATVRNSLREEPGRSIRHPL